MFAQHFGHTMDHQIYQHSINPGNVNRAINASVAVTQYSPTARLWVAERGNEGVVKLLFERVDMDPNAPETEFRWIPLRQVPWAEHEEILKLLLTREDITSNIADTNYGRILFFWAAERGHQGVLKLLLEQEGINPNIVDIKYG